MDDISFSKRRKNRGYTYLCAGSAICVSLLRAPQYSTFACCLIPVLTLVVLLVMLHDIDDISFSKRRYFLIVSWISISVYCIPTRDTHIPRDMCMGIHISRGYTYPGKYWLSDLHNISKTWLDRPKMVFHCSHQRKPMIGQHELIAFWKGLFPETIQSQNKKSFAWK